MFADVVMLNGATLLGLLISFAIQSNSGLRSEPFGTFLVMNLASIIIINLCCIPCFYFFGFYTRGRAYQGKYKVLIVSQAVGVGYLAFTAFCFLMPTIFVFPRVGLVLGAVLSAIFLAGARIWMAAWQGFSQVEP